MTDQAATPAGGNDELVEILAQTEVFGSLGAPDLLAIAESADETREPAGSVLMRAGDAADAFYVLRRGRVVVVDEIEGGEDRILNELGPGAVLGELALLAGGDRSATVRVTEEATLLRITRAAFERLIESHPAILARSGELVRRRLRRSQLADYLARFVGPLAPSMLHSLEQTVGWVSLGSGETLFRQGDSADAAFGVVSGRLRIVAGGGEEEDDEDRAEIVLSEVGHGETVGEMALLSEDTRSAAAYAIRDTDLVRFPRQLFEELVREHPQVMTQITRLLVQRLKSRNASVRTLSGAAAHTLALIPARGDLPLGDFARRLAEALGAEGPTLHLTAQRIDQEFGKPQMAHIARTEPASLRLVQWLNEQETKHRFVLYQAEEAWSGWTERCARQADHVIVVASVDSTPEPEALEQQLDRLWQGRRSPRRSLVLLHPDSETEPLGTAQWLDQRRADRHYHLRLSSRPDFGRLARALSGRAIGLVLGGGGARGFAHIGVIRAIQELGIPIDMVGGTSMGALIAASAAMGWSWEEIQEGCRQHSIRVFDPTLPLVSLLAGRKIWRGISASFGVRAIEDLWIPYLAVSTNLTRAESVVQQRGSLAEAVRCSISLPGIMPPVHRDGDLFVDGGLLDNVPIEAMNALSEGGRVIASDVSPEVDLASSQGFPSELSGWRLFWERLSPWARPPDVPGIHSVLVRSTLLASTHARNRTLATAQLSLYLQPQVDRWGILDFRSLDEIVQAGYDSAIDPLRKWWAREQTHSSE